MRCTRGAVFDVVVDLRPESPTLLRAGSASSCSADNGRALFIPGGFAHGFQTLEDDTEVLYLMCHDYVPDGGARRALGRPGVRDRVARAARGRRTISERDAAYPDFRAVSRVLVTGATGFIGRTRSRRCS